MERELVEVGQWAPGPLDPEPVFSAAKVEDPLGDVEPRLEKIKKKEQEPVQKKKRTSAAMLGAEL